LSEDAAIFETFDFQAMDSEASAALARDEGATREWARGMSHVGDPPRC
jgi:hypothetical protein